MMDEDPDAVTDLDMHPLAPTREALAELDPEGDLALLERLGAKTSRVRQVVPECVGVSITLTAEEITFTFAATGHGIATLDAVQYLDGGPCANVPNDPHVREYTSAELDEQQWQLFASATAEAGIASTLTMPLRDDSGNVVGSVNFYGTEPSCFDGHHDELAQLFAGWAPGAVTNADLTFAMGRRAQRAPRRIHDQRLVSTAVGVIAARAGISTDEAAVALYEAADRAGVDQADLADAVLRAHGRRLT